MEETGYQLLYAPSADQRIDVVFSLREPETESKLSGHPCRVDNAGLTL